ncbi:MAG: ComF family protein [bacterium]|nr:ComF family protein [bacterium]
MWTGFRDLLFPKNCRICQNKFDSNLDSPGNICTTCWSRTEYLFPPYCLRCGHPSGDGHSAECKHCENLYPAFSLARGVGKYNGTLREAIHLLKFQFKDDLVNPLANLYLHYIARSRDFADYQTYDYIVPVPLHKTKLREREFNQVELLAKQISHQLDISLSTDNLYRKRYTTPQMRMPAEKRLANVQNAFAVREPTQFKQKKILLLDDIMTTGATVNECSRVLMNAGSERVTVLVLARG